MTPWERAITALRLVQCDPDGLGGIVLHARSGPAREAYVDVLPAHTRLHVAMPSDALVGGIDVSASLIEGSAVQTKGLLDTYAHLFLLPMAERASQTLANHLTQCLDQKRGNAIILLDEHTEDEEAPVDALTDRLAFHVNLDGLSISELGPPASLDDPCCVLANASDTDIETIVMLAERLGIHSLRCAYHALCAAKANAGLNGRNRVADKDIILAAELVLAPRATQLPLEEDPPEPPQQENRDETDSNPGETTDLPDEMILAAIETALPADLLAGKDSGQRHRGAGGGSGKKRIGNRKGRPLPPRDTNAKKAQSRVDLTATLRAAVPWQTIRKRGRSAGPEPVIRPSDLRYKRYEELSDRLLIFAVDASGSAALARLAEAKGAIEHLLAEAYASRDHVALASFRGDKAELLLPPTRSLVQTKRRLADLPGGGGTPLAAGLKLALETADTAQRRGQTPVIILLTDGRSNVTLDGAPDRAAAKAEADTWAKHIAATGTQCIVVDTSRRPSAALQELSTSLRGRYVSLPRANAQTLSEAVTATLGS